MPAPARPAPAGAVASAAAARFALPPLSPPALAACRAIGRVFDQAQDVVLTTHVNPDGDGLGAEAALAAWLLSRGIPTRILNADPAPRQFRFLAVPGAPFTVFRGFEEDELDTADTLVMLDTGLRARLGSVGEALPRMTATRVIVDHHAAREGGLEDAPVQDGAHPPGSVLGFVDPDASSTSELVYRLLDVLEVELTPAMALQLYAGIAFDTGSFRFSNTRRETHLVAADLLRHGVAPESLYREMFATHSLARMHLWGSALSGLRLDAGGRLAWMAVDGAMLAAVGARPGDMEGLVEQGRMVAGVEVAILFREEEPGRTKISFRSNAPVDVNALASRFGGGGHVNAAGATVTGPLADVVERVLAEARRVLEPPA